MEETSQFLASGDFVFLPKTMKLKERVKILAIITSEISEYWIFAKNALCFLLIVLAVQ